MSNNIDPKDLKSVDKQKASELFNRLSQKDKEKVNKILADKEALAKILNSPQAVELMKKLNGGKNG